MVLAYDINAMTADVRTLLDHMDGEYVGPNISATMRRLREVVGEST